MACMPSMRGRQQSRCSAARTSPVARQLRARPSDRPRHVCRGAAGQKADDAAAWRLCIYKRPLVGWEDITQAVAPLGISLDLHTYVTVENTATGQVLLADFLPKDPASFATTTRLLLLNKSPGEVNLLQLKEPPSSEPCYRTTLQAPSDFKTCLEDFNRSWDADLHLLTNNCHHYTMALVRHLAGEDVSIKPVALVLKRELATQGRRMESNVLKQEQ